MAHILTSSATIAFHQKSVKSSGPAVQGIIHLPPGALSHSSANRSPRRSKYLPNTSNVNRKRESKSKVSSNLDQSFPTPISIKFPKPHSDTVTSRKAYESSKDIDIKPVALTLEPSPISHFAETGLVNKNEGRKGGKRKNLKKLELKEKVAPVDLGDVNLSIDSVVQENVSPLYPISRPSTPPNLMSGGTLSLPTTPLSSFHPESQSRGVQSADRAKKGNRSTRRRNNKNKKRNVVQESQRDDGLETNFDPDQDGSQSEDDMPLPRAASSSPVPGFVFSSSAPLTSTSLSHQSSTPEMVSKLERQDSDLSIIAPTEILNLDNDFILPSTPTRNYPGDKVSASITRSSTLPNDLPTKEGSPKPRKNKRQQIPQPIPMPPPNRRASQPDIYDLQPSSASPYGAKKQPLTWQQELLGTTPSNLSGLDLAKPSFNGSPLSRRKTYSTREDRGKKNVHASKSLPSVNKNKEKKEDFNTPRSAKVEDTQFQMDDIFSTPPSVVTSTFTSANDLLNILNAAPSWKKSKRGTTPPPPASAQMGSYPIHKRNLSAGAGTMLGMAITNGTVKKADFGVRGYAGPKFHNSPEPRDLGRTSY